MDQHSTQRIIQTQPNPQSPSSSLLSPEGLEGAPAACTGSQQVPPAPQHPSRPTNQSCLFYCDNCAGCVRSSCRSCQPSHQPRGGPSAEAPGHSTAGFKCQNALKACSFSTQGPALYDPAISVSPPLQQHDTLRGITRYHGKCRRELGPPLRPSPRCPPEQSRHEECKMSSLLSSLITVCPPEQGLTSTVPRSPPTDTAHSPSSQELPPQRGQPRTSSRFRGCFKARFSAAPYFCQGGSRRKLFPSF